MDNGIKNNKKNTIMTIAAVAWKAFAGIFKMVFKAVFTLFKWVLEGRELF